MKQFSFYNWNIFFKFEFSCTFWVLLAARVGFRSSDQESMRNAWNMHFLQCSSSCFSPLFVSSLRRQPLRSFGLKNIFDGFKSASFQVGREFGFQLQLPFFGCNSLQVCFAFLQSIHMIKFVLTQYCNKVDILNVGVAWSVRLHTAGLSPLAPTARDSRAHNFVDAL